MRKAQKDPQRWLTNLVKTMMDQLEIWNCQSFDKLLICNIYGTRIKAIVLKMTPATRGEIADLAQEDWAGYSEVGTVNMMNTGKEIVTYTAVRTIIVCMCKLLHNRKVPIRCLYGRPQEWPHAWSQP